jgi:hypothetical protein
MAPAIAANAARAEASSAKRFRGGGLFKTRYRPPAAASAMAPKRPTFKKVRRDKEEEDEEDEEDKGGEGILCLVF